MVAVLGSVLLVVLAGLPIGYVLLRDLRLALLIAPLVTGLTATASVILMLVVGGQLWWSLLALLVLQWAATPVLLRKVPPVRAPHRSWVDLLWLTVPLLPPFLMVFLPPVQWDSNSIWWLHAAYFTKGGPMVREYLGLHSINLTHPDYPPLASATVAAAWTVFHGYGFYVAQFISATLSFSSIATLGYAVRVVTGRAPALVSRLAAVAVAIAAWTTDSSAVAGGYVDPLWATAFVAAALLLLIRPNPLRRPLLAVLLMAVAAFTKNEGLVMTAVLAGLATIRARHSLRRARVLWLPVAGGLVWSVLARHFGAKSDIASQVDLGSVLHGDPQVYDRLPPTLASIWGWVGTIVAVSLATAIFSGLTLRRQRRASGLGSDLWLWATGVAYLGILSMTYVVSTNPIRWYLDTSISRVTLPFALLCVASAACWAVVAVTGGRTRGERAASTAKPPKPVSAQPPPSGPESTPVPANPEALGAGAGVTSATR